MPKSCSGLCVIEVCALEVWLVFLGTSAQGGWLKNKGPSFEACFKDVALPERKPILEAHLGSTWAESIPTLEARPVAFPMDGASSGSGPRAPKTQKNTEFFPSCRGVEKRGRWISPEKLQDARV